MGRLGYYEEPAVDTGRPIIINYAWDDVIVDIDLTRSSRFLDFATCPPNVVMVNVTGRGKGRRGTGSR